MITSTTSLAIPAAIAFLVGTLFVADDIDDIKEVYKSSLTGKCVKIIDHSQGEPIISECSELPNKYTVVWVR